MIAYARVYRCDRLMLLYPAGADGGGGVARSFGLAHGRERLDVATVDVRSGGAAVRRQLRELMGVTSGRQDLGS